jgi:hypothetical protein
MKHRLAIIGLAAGLAGGGAAGVVLGSPGVSGAATTDTTAAAATTDTTAAAATTAPTAAAATTAPTTPIDTSNHDPVHEAAETAQQAADEASGKFQGGGGGKSNTDPAHEAAESPARAAAEAAHDATITTPTTTGG